MNRTRYKIALLVGGSVLGTLLLMLAVFNFEINRSMDARAAEAIHVAQLEEIEAAEEDEEELTEAAEDDEAVEEDDEDEETTLYTPVIIDIDDNERPDWHERGEVYRKERQIVGWFKRHGLTGVQRVKIGVNTYYLSVIQQGEGWTQLAYVDVTGEPEMIWRINLFVLFAAAVIGLFGTVEGYFIGKRLEQNQLAQKQFFENTSHELKTPLTSIRGYAEGIQTGVITDTRRTGRAIAAQTEKMSRLVEEILCMAKIESGALPLRREPVDVDEFIENCLMPFEGAVASRGLKVSLSLNGGTVQADPEQLEHAVTNLMTNAVKFAAERIEIASDGGAIRIWNDCEPISEEELKHLFDRFYTGRNGNTGIGLAIARDIVRLHGGSVRAEYEGGGLAITLRGLGG